MGQLFRFTFWVVLWLTKGKEAILTFLSYKQSALVHV
ncbi:hypothetical protein SPLC1_S052070 [Arthrospira platensis C1]|uniref:Uncharacterized protein n=1 Tax=Limnospira maxima CS-328 TaxID=513049 RepID=B5W6P0_LIMMA|nr:hypothetical protein AmaxDRAFT_4439 [Limnospira maxima CS-328]EKD10999.1 hypothetical protein SPLC1_S052070 [Arthrospira platensis C1]